MTSIQMQTVPPSQGSSSTVDLPKYWKEIGYRGYSAFLASDNDFMIFRRYGTLNARLLLYLQDQIAVLESELEALEARHADPSAGDVNNGSFRQDPLPARKLLLDRVLEKVKEYNDLLLQQTALRGHPVVPKRDLKSIKNWHHNTPHAILRAETDYLEQFHDLIQLVPKSITPLRRVLEKSTRFRLSKLWARKDPPLPQYCAHPEELHYSSDQKIDNTIGITITALGMMMLIVPLWVLNGTNGAKTRLGVITGFIILFLALIAFTTVARPFESLAAAAAYSAVLVVFLQSA